MPFLITILIYVILILAIYWYISFRRLRKNLYIHSKLIPGFPELPFIGNLHIVLGKTTADVSGLQKLVIDETWKNGGISKFWLGPYLYITITDPKYAETVLSQAMDRDIAFKYAESWVGNGLICGPTPVWRAHRKFIAPAFNQKTIENCVDIFSEKSEILVEKLIHKLGKGEFDIEKYINYCSGDIIYKATIGDELDTQEGKNMSFIEAVHSQTNIVNARMIQAWLRLQWVFNLTPYAKQEEKNINFIHKFTNDNIKRKESEIESKSMITTNDEVTESPTILESLLKSAKQVKFSDVDLRNNIVSLISVGSDTSINVTCFVLTLLGSMPEIQEKIANELTNIFGDSKRRVQKDDLSKMKYLECVIKETMRLFPVIPILIRRVNHDIELDKYTIPAGSSCAIMIAGLHRDKRVWGENAEEFNPDRFLPENINTNNRHPYSYIPFSAGIKNCIGMQFAMKEMKTMIATILRSYKIRTNVDYKNLPMKFEILMKPLNGYIVSIEPRMN